MAGNVAMVNGWRQGPLLFTAHLAPLHPDTHTIYEDNRRTHRAPLEHSLMDVHVAGRGEKARGRQEERIWKAKIEVGISCSFIIVNCVS